MENTEEKMIEVYHFDMKHAVSEGKTLYFLSPSLSEVKDLAEKGLYQKVADVFTDDLEFAFEKTNHINNSWQENKEVYSLKNKARSTSVGDLFIREIHLKDVKEDSIRNNEDKFSIKNAFDNYILERKDLTKESIDQLKNIVMLKGV